MLWKDAKKKLLQDEGRRQAYEQIDLAYEIGKMVSEARVARRMTQVKLAEKLGTHQPSIARLESGSYVPSLPFLQRLAKIFGTQLLPPRFEFLVGRENDYAHSVTIPTIQFHQPLVSGEPRDYIRYNGSGLRSGAANAFGSSELQYVEGVIL